MRIPFKSEEELQARYEKLSELARFEYHKRLVDAKAFAITGHLAWEAASKDDAAIVERLRQARKMRITFLLTATLLGFVAWAFRGEVPRNAIWILILVWTMHSLLTNHIVIPQMQAHREDRMEQFQVLARQWGDITGSAAFSEFVKAIGKEFSGRTAEDFETIWLATRGTTLITVANLAALA
jgi:hypothetical protein